MTAEVNLSGGTAIYSDLVQFENDPAIITFGNGDVVRIPKCLSFPGLVNSHDHLDLDLLPLLKNRIYKDYREWGGDIHLNNKDIIDRVQEIPLLYRLRWGVLKNLVNGFTGIVHHGTAHDMFRSIPYPVFLNYQYLHTPGTERWWRLKINLPGRSDVMIHVGEGADENYTKEIDSLLRWNLLGKNIIGIHAIRMTEKQSKGFKAVVWCPESNFNLYGITAPMGKLKQHTHILFGTDSTASASANHWQQLRNARATGLLSDEEIFDTLTKTPGDIFKFDRQNAVVITRRHHDGWDGFFGTTPSDILLIVHNNKVVLVDNSIKKMPPDSFDLVSIDGESKWIDRALNDNVIHQIAKHNIKPPLNITAL